MARFHSGRTVRNWEWSTQTEVKMSYLKLMNVLYIWLLTILWNIHYNNVVHQSLAVVFETKVCSSVGVHSTLDGFSESRTHRQRWMFPKTRRTLTNRNSSSATRTSVRTLPYTPHMVSISTLLRPPPPNNQRLERLMGSIVPGDGVQNKLNQEPGCSAQHVSSVTASSGWSPCGEQKMQ